MSAAVPDPRFRDQLAEAIPDWCGLTDYEPALLADALMPTIAAEVEARVQAANQRAAEELRATAFSLDNFADEQSGWCGPWHDFADGLRLRAAALASPAPALDAEEGQ